MSAISKIGTTVLVALFLTSTAFAGNTSTSATLRLTVNVVPVVQVLNPVQENATAIKFADSNGQFYLDQQQRSEPVSERINISHPLGSNFEGGRAPIATNVNAILLRQTFVAK